MGRWRPAARSTRIEERLEALLTPEQKTRLNALHKARGFRGHRGFSPRHGADEDPAPDEGGSDDAPSR
jgi:hypothetical protein